MRKIFIFAAILTTIILLGGCTQQTGTQAGYYKYTGDKAVEAKFLASSPVSSELDTYQKNENIDVVVELVNKLPEEIPAGQVKTRLTGDAAISTFFEGAKEVANPKIFPIDATTGVATPEEVEVGPIRYVGELTAKVPKKITGQYCYSMPVKVKANLFYVNDETKVGTNLPSGSNPPSTVQVILLQQGAVSKADDGKGELRFKVTVKNMGTGIILPSLSDCFKYRERTEREELTIEAKGAYPITCDDNPIRLSRTDQSKIIDCTVTGIDLTNLNAEPSELSLTLKGFAYQEELAPVTIWLEQ